MTPRFIVVFLTPIFFIKGEGTPDVDTIPHHLHKCYTGGVDVMPFTVRNLADIIRKLEHQTYRVHSTRSLTAMILRRYWVEGVERDPNVPLGIPDLVPYRVSAFQYYRYKLLREEFLPGEDWQHGNLTDSEECSLHLMLSSTVDPWERGDEQMVCPSRIRGIKVMSEEGTAVSWCPLEGGVVAGSTADVSPSRVLAAVVAALQPVSVPTDKWIPGTPYLVSSLWAATLAGDLAEVGVLQAGLERRDLATDGFWADPIVPTARYLYVGPELLSNRQWQLTTAEIEGAMAGLLVSRTTQQWEAVGRGLRLSHLVEMTLSPLGPSGGITPYRGLASVPHRPGDPFLQRLIHQTTGMALLLNQISPASTLSSGEVENVAEEAVKTFARYITSRRNNSTEGKNLPKYLNFRKNTHPSDPKLSLTIVFDSTWTLNQTLHFVMMACEAVDVWRGGSKLSVVDGSSGETIVDRATTAGQAYLDWNKVYHNHHKTGRGTGTLDLTKSLLTVRRGLRVEKSDEEEVGVYSQKVLILGLSSPLTDKDIDLAASHLAVATAINPETNFLFIARKLGAESYSPLLDKSGIGSNGQLQVVSSVDPEQVLIDVLPKLLEGERSLKPLPCLSNLQHPLFQELINPEVVYNYSIHQEYFCRGWKNATVQVENGGYGSVNACHGEVCRQLAPYGRTEFPVATSCTEGICRSFRLSLTGLMPLNNCLGRMCRRPDQIMVTIQLNQFPCYQANQPLTCSATTRRLTSILFLLFMTLTTYI